METVMANFRYFADLNGEAFELQNVWHDGSVGSKAKNFTGLLPTGQRVAATRLIQMKSMPSRHECDARCMNATGRTMNCECACGGKNHGRGSFMGAAQVEAAF
jgi:hypothetical protein